MSDLSPASSAYYHPRRPRALRVGDRVRVTTPARRDLGPRPNPNYPGARNYGTVVSLTPDLPYPIEVRCDTPAGSGENYVTELFHEHEVTLL